MMKTVEVVESKVTVEVMEAMTKHLATEEVRVVKGMGSPGYGTPVQVAGEAKPLPHKLAKSRFPLIISSFSNLEIYSCKLSTIFIGRMHYLKVGITRQGKARFRAVLTTGH